MNNEAEDETFKTQSKQFIDWLVQNGTTISSKIELADLRHRSAGRGVLAKEDLGRDEELFSITRTSILTFDNSSLPKELRQGQEDPWLSLILAMIYAYQQGPESKWKAYFDVLPTTFDTLMYWSDEELEQLKGSAIVDKIGRDTADETFKRRVIPIMREHASLFHATDLSDDVLLSLCHRMGSTIMAYAFDLERPADEGDDGWEEDSDSGETLPKGMVPLADMLNADADRNNAKLFYEDDKVVMRTIKAVKKGEELFNDYGPLPRADVLRRYGYVTENYAKYDLVEIPSELVIEAVREESKIADEDFESRMVYIDEQDILEDGCVVFWSSNEDGQFPEVFTSVLNALVMPTSDFNKLMEKGKLPKPELTKEALRLLYSILVRRRAMYAASHEPSDHETPARAGSQNDVSISTRSERRRIMAMQVIQGEKEVLQEAADTVRRLLGEDKKRNATSFEDEANNLMHHSKKARRDDSR